MRNILDVPLREQKLTDKALACILLDDYLSVDEFEWVFRKAFVFTNNPRILGHPHENAIYLPELLINAQRNLDHALYVKVRDRLLDKLQIEL